ncbi:hypothetical protein R3P38DRAFT_3291813 [Favolaschia claudopus]|uniref:Uncharacterized protein n=1 Tax=Favolaschia claudopus TaxID=2862362 RepID=A0AAV9ZMS0_9AGAR
MGPACTGSCQAVQSLYPPRSPTTYPKSTVPRYMCRYIVERDYCKLCRSFRPEVRFRKNVDCNDPNCRYSEAHHAHPRQVRLRRALFMGMLFGGGVPDHRNRRRHLAERLLFMMMFRRRLLEARLAAAAVVATADAAAQENHGHY